MTAAHVTGSLPHTDEVHRIALPYELNGLRLGTLERDGGECGVWVRDLLEVVSVVGTDITDSDTACP